MNKLVLSFVFLMCQASVSIAQQNVRVSGYMEYDAKSYLDNNKNNLDPIEGIWQTSEGRKIAIEKDVVYGSRSKEKFRMVILESDISCWKLGDVNGYITHGSTNSIYSLKLLRKWSGTGEYAGTTTHFLILENPILGHYSYTTKRATYDLNVISKDVDVTMYKLYPKDSPSTNSSSSVQPSKSKWSGTGFFLTKNGYIITNHHVVEGAKTIKVTSVNGNHNKIYNARVEVSDKQNDLAIIKITDSFSAISSIPYTFKFSASSIGENCWVLGYPLTQTMGEDIKLTNGIISSKSGFDGNIAQYQISAPVQPGNSGGPVFDAKGNMIGVVQAKHGGAENASYAIKASYVRNLVEMLSVSISYPTVNKLAGKSLPKQVELASQCVCLIVCE